MSCVPPIPDRDVVYYLRDTDSVMVKAWTETFKEYPEKFKISKGDIFKEAPETDAIVAPANSFGFMDGGIDGACHKKFGDQIQKNLQQVIQTKYDGEVLVGQAVIIPTDEKESAEAKGGKAIKYLISAPTVRIPVDISNTVNVYLCFRAILLAVGAHNHTVGNDQIRSVLIPGLGTGHGKMPKVRSAQQMLQAYETYVTEAHPARLMPETAQYSSKDHKKMCKYDEKNSGARPKSA